MFQITFKLSKHRTELLIKETTGNCLIKNYYNRTKKDSYNYNTTYGTTKLGTPFNMIGHSTRL